MKWPKSRGPHTLKNKFEIKEHDYISDVCPKPLINDVHIYYIKLYIQYKNGVLPVSGGYLEQPNIFLEYIEAIESS